MCSKCKKAAWVCSQLACKQNLARGTPSLCVQLLVFPFYIFSPPKLFCLRPNDNQNMIVEETNQPLQVGEGRRAKIQALKGSF